MVEIGEFALENGKNALETAEFTVRTKVNLQN